jgi:ribosomal protein S18 acetylase RimI-like enzyme
MKMRNYRDSDFPLLEHLLKDSGIYESYDNREVFKRKIKDDPGSIIVMEDDKSVIGCVFLIYDAWNSSIFHLCIHPDYRDRGLGKKLLKRAEDVLKSRGVRRCILFVEGKNRHTASFYKKMGWSLLANDVIAMQKDYDYP